MGKLKMVGGLMLAFVLIYVLGPTAPEAEINPSPIEIERSIEGLDNWIAQKEHTHPSLKPNNEARITWLNDAIQKTPFSVVFLHGYSASRMEGSPLTKEFAERYGCNLYEARLAKHGLDTADAMMDITPENYLQSAKEAIAIGKLIGDSVIVISSSTGSTLGLYLASADPLVHSVFCYSPNIDLVDQTSKLITGPWGLHLLRMVFGGDFREYEASKEFKKYWVNRYRIEALITMRSLLDNTMTAQTFSRIHQPVFVGCYYRDEEHQDPIVSVPAMRKMMEELGTRHHQKRMVEFANVNAHVITSPFRCQDMESVRLATFAFAEGVLGLDPNAEE